jgi:mono/diheme cytochrome c family protein
MSSRVRSPLLICLSLLSVTTVVAEERAAVPDFKRDVLPVLQSRCIRCHGPEEQNSDIRLDNLSTDLIKDRRAAENWNAVLNTVNRGEMPPEDEAQLTVKERQTLTSWLTTQVDAAIEAQRKTSGRVVMRRLNRVEYQNTMTDLLGLDMDYVRDLPPDSASPDGFTNNGQSLQMSALQLEYYLDAARRALDRVIVGGPAPRVYEYTFTESNVKGWLNDVERSNQLGRRQSFLGTMIDDYPEEGEFRIRVTLTADIKPDKGFPLLEVSVGYRPDTKILFRAVETIEITDGAEQTFEFRGRLENHPLPVRGQGKFPGLVVRLRNTYDDGSPLPRAEKGKKDKKSGAVYPVEPDLPTLLIKSVDFAAPVFDQWPPTLHRRILFASDLRESDETGYVKAVLQQFMPRAFRRPVTGAEVDRLADFFTSLRPEFPTFEDAIRETLAMVLIQPDFLYLFEAGNAGEGDRSITDSELASRLAYFLTSTMPDETLREVAAKDVLRQAESLTVQIDRLLDDPRSQRFIDQFTSQWLHLDVVDSVAISPDYYPGFDDTLKADMRAETQRFFGHLLQADLSAINLLSSDFSMLNERLARHYGIEGVHGREFRPVKLPPDQHRGGLLGHASILLSGSTGEDSHAVRRAVWIRDRLLDDPPATPPPNVPGLDKADPQFLKLSIREQLVIHRGTEACANCHRGIDPWGIALENFDAIGRWRTEVRRKNGRNFESLPVNAADTLPNGHELDGVDSLREYLLTKRKDDFARSLVSRLLTYALGRRLELADQAVVEELSHEFAENGYRLRPLIHAIVASEPFQTK